MKPNQDPKPNQAKSNDDLLEEAHEQYIAQLTESGVPWWYAELMSYFPITPTRLREDTTQQK